MMASHLSKRGALLSTFRCNQEWSLPDSIIYYMVKNPSSSKVYEKLIKSCKYFFIKNSLLVVECLFIDYDEDEWRIYLNYEYFDLQNITSKIWVTNKLAIDGIVGGEDHQFPISSVTSMFYQFDIKKVFLTYQNITFDDLILLATNCEEINLCMVTVKDENDAVVTLEKIIEALLNVKSFRFYLEHMPSTTIITTDTVQKLLQIPHFCNLNYFFLNDIPDSFDIDAFYSYIKINKHTKLHLNFSHHQNRLQEIVNEIIQTEEHDYMVPLIIFPGHDRASCKKLRHLHDYN